MQSKNSEKGGSWLVNGLGILAFILILVELGGVNLPLLSDDRWAVVALGGLGVLMCASGMGRQIELHGWAHWSNLLGIVLGAAVTLLVSLMFLGVYLPLLPDAHSLFYFIAVVLLGKWALAWVFGRGWPAFNRLVNL